MTSINRSNDTTSSPLSVEKLMATRGLKKLKEQRKVEFYTGLDAHNRLNIMKAEIMK